MSGWDLLFAFGAVMWVVIIVQRIGIIRRRERLRRFNERWERAEQRNWDDVVDAQEEYDDSPERTCTWCGGDGFAECLDPLQCSDPSCDGEVCRCTACDGRGYDQDVW